MKHKHTPGPWRIKNDMLVMADDEEICYLANLSPTSASYEETVANARLIAAAPKLLKACIFTLVIIEGYDPPIDEPYRRCTAILQQLKNGIAEAIKGI